jgi:hypothetical protein
MDPDPSEQGTAMTEPEIQASYTAVTAPGDPVRDPTMPVVEKAGRQLRAP